MPRGDGTGPMGLGQMTGRGAGYCSGFATPGYANSVGCGVGFGRGRGFRRAYNATGLPRGARYNCSPFAGAYEPFVGEKELLSQQEKFLENQLHQVKQRLSNFKEDDE